MFLFRGKDEAEEKKEKEDESKKLVQSNKTNKAVAKASPRPHSKLFAVPLETIALHEAKASDDASYFVPIIVKEAVEWLRTHNGMQTRFVSFSK